MAICSIVIFVPLIAWRLKYYNKLFENAEEITGYITAISFYRDRGKVRYEYKYNSRSSR